MNLNKIHLIGRVTRDPELKTTQGGTSVATFGLATNRTWKGKDGEKKKEEVQFHNCVAFGRVAEIAAQYAKKGQELYIGGRMQYRQWTDKSGAKRTSAEVIVEDLQLGAQARGARAATAKEEEVDTIPEIEEGEPVEFDPNDIPF